MGHRLVGYIGEKKLDPQTRVLLEPLLQQPIDVYNATLTRSLSSFSDAAIWMDEVKNSAIPDLHKNHYINTPLYLNEINQTLTRADVMERMMRTSTASPYNVFTCLNWSLYQLAGYFSDEQVTQERAAALRYLLHLMGDLHQPLHIISLMLSDRQDDEGGNKLRLTQPIEVENLDRQIQKVDKLHMVWDSTLGSITQDAIHSTIKPRNDRQEVLAQAYQDLETKFGNQPDTDITSIPEWAVSLFFVAQTQIYQQIKINLTSKNEKSYIWVELTTSPAEYKNTVAPIAQQAIWKGGVRLAGLLNTLRVQKFQAPFAQKKNWAPML